MEEFFTLDNVSTGDIFPNVNFDIFPQFFEQSDDSLLEELSTLDETQPTVSGVSLMSAQMQRTETCPIRISEELQQQHSSPVESVSDTLTLPPQLGQEDQSRFPVVSNDEIMEINHSAASKNTKRTTQTWLTVWRNWCLARNIDDKMECFSPQVLDGILTKFYAEVRKKDGSEYESDSLRVMQASLDRYLRQKKLFGIHYQRARVQKVSRDSKFQGKMSQVPRQRKTAQQSSAVQSSRRRNFLE